MHLEPIKQLQLVILVQIPEQFNPLQKLELCFAPLFIRLNDDSFENIAVKLPHNHVCECSDCRRALSIVQEGHLAECCSLSKDFARILRL
jgi:hypothetical protein